MKLGIIGADTSHAPAFAMLLNDPTHPYYVPGGHAAKVFPGGSDDFPLSANRISGFVAELKTLHVEVAGSLEEAIAGCDGILLLSGDGRVHRKQLEAAASTRKPVFVDKPLALSVREAQEMIGIAERWGLPLMSCSALRFDETLQRLKNGGLDVDGADVTGPLPLEPLQNDIFWYGIHAAEMLYTFLGPGCREVIVHEQGHSSCTITGVWKDGRTGTIRGRYNGSGGFTAAVHRSESTETAIIGGTGKPFYASLLEQVLEMFRTGISPVPLEETLEIIAFLEAANESRGNPGSAVRLPVL